MSTSTIHHSERLLVIVGPSGAGKDSVLAAWRARLHGHDIHFARRVITRPPDASEAHDCVSEGEFRSLRTRGELAAWWHANGWLYGVRRSELSPLARGAWVVMNGSREHLAGLRQQAPALHAVEITAPSSVLAQRLAERGREDAAAVAHRLARRPSAPVSLSLSNAGTLSATVDALHAWWLDRAGAPAPG